MTSKGKNKILEAFQINEGNFMLGLLEKCTREFLLCPYWLRIWNQLPLHLSSNIPRRLVRQMAWKFFYKKLLPSYRSQRDRLSGITPWSEIMTFSSPFSFHGLTDDSIKTFYGDAKSISYSLRSHKGWCWLKNTFQEIRHWTSRELSPPTTA